MCSLVKETPTLITTIPIVGGDMVGNVDDEGWLNDDEGWLDSSFPLLCLLEETKPRVQEES